MSKPETRETKITKFDRRVSTELRTGNKYASAIKHFDVLSQEGKLIPKVGLEDDTFNSNLSTDSTKARLTKFLTYGTTNSNFIQFALGKDETGAGNTPRLYYRDAVPHNQWSGDSGTTGALNENLFIEYKGIAYASNGSTGLISWTLDISAPLGGSTVTNPVHALTHTNIFQGLVFSKDNILYIPYLISSGAFILSFDGSTWTDDAFAGLPSSIGGMDICEKGDFLVIGTKPKFYGGKSYVYLWDRDSSLTAATAKIDWGSENLEIIENVDDILIGISLEANSSIFFGDKTRVHFKYWDGSGDSAKKLFTLEAEDLTIQISQKQKINNRLYFMMSIKLNGSWHEGVWSIGRNKSGEFTLVCEYLINNDTQVTSFVPKGFQILGDYLTVSYSDNGNYQLKVTDNGETYLDTSIYETDIFNWGDSTKIKKLIRASITTEPLPSAGQIVLKYAIDENIKTNTWTTIFTNTTDNSISHTAINIESSGANLPQYKEIMFRVESIGGAVPTGLKFEEQLVDKNI